MAEKMDMDGKTPLISAALYGDIETVRCLLDSGANIKARDVFGRTPLIAATATWKGPMHCTVEIVRLLLDHGADVNAQNKKGRTALMEALAHRDFTRQQELVELLVSRGADIRLKDTNGVTAVQMATDSQAALLKGVGSRQ